MNILITNDDGYGAWGIEALTDRLAKDHNVYVVAPDGNRSGSGMSVNITTPLQYSRKADKRFTCSGSPVDCMVAGLMSDLIGEKIDLVVSGINHGPNLGTDILYSGTCSAAKEATMMGVPAIAVSLSIPSDLDWDDKNSWNFKPMADFIADNIDLLMSLARPSLVSRTEVADKRGVFVNVNAFSSESYKGVKMTDCCFMLHDGSAKLTVNGENKNDFTSVFWGMHSKAARRDGSDYLACKEGYVSVSRVLAEPVIESLDAEEITWNV